MSDVFDDYGSDNISGGVSVSAQRRDAAMDFGWLRKFDDFLTRLKRAAAGSERAALSFLKGNEYLATLAKDARGPIVEGDFKIWLLKNWPLLKDRVELNAIDGNVRDAAHALTRVLEDPEHYGQGIPLERWAQNLIDWMEKFATEINKFLSQMTDERFTYKGLRIWNQERLPEPVVRDLLGAIDYVVALFKKRGVASVLDNLLTSITLTSQIPDTVGLYFPSDRSIRLSAEAIGQGGRMLQYWVGEVFLHEVAHHVHMTLLDKQAKAEWDSSWEPINLMKKERDKIRNVTFADRTRFWGMLSAAKGDLRKVKLKGLDRMKFHAWLSNPHIGGSLVTPKNLQWSKDGAWIRPFLEDPDQALYESWDTPEGNKKRVEFRTRQLKSKLGVLPSESDANWPVLSMEQVAKYATDDPEIEKALQALETPTKYAQTNENEDFAETFVAYMDAPEKLSPTARYRMQRALWLSGFGGRPILKTVASTSPVVSAKRWVRNVSKQRRMERQALRNKRFRRIPIEVTSQPERKRSRFVGRVTYEWITGPKKGVKVSVPITLTTRARISIRGRDLYVQPVGGIPYVWGEAAEREEKDDKRGDEPKAEEPIRKSDHARKQEKNFIRILREKFDELVKERGPLEAGVSLARGFVRAHNKAKARKAKLALAKLYGLVLKTNKAAHRSFSRAVRSSVSLARKVPVEEARETLSKSKSSAHITSAKKIKRKSKQSPVAQAREKVRNADAYRKEHGQCPDGFHYNKRKKSCRSAPTRQVSDLDIIEEKPVEAPSEPAKQEPKKEPLPEQKAKPPEKKKPAPRPNAPKLDASDDEWVEYGETLKKSVKAWEDGHDRWAAMEPAPKHKSLSPKSQAEWDEYDRLEAEYEAAIEKWKGSEPKPRRDPDAPPPITRLKKPKAYDFKTDLDFQRAQEAYKAQDAVIARAKKKWQAAKPEPPPPEDGKVARQAYLAKLSVWRAREPVVD